MVIRRITNLFHNVYKETLPIFRSKKLNIGKVFLIMTSASCFMIRRKLFRRQSFQAYEVMCVFSDNRTHHDYHGITVQSSFGAQDIYLLHIYSTTRNCYMLQGVYSEMAQDATWKRIE